MRGIKTSILAVSVLAFAGTAGAVDWSAICCDGGYEYRHPSAWEKEQQRLRDELAASRLASRDTGKAAAELAAADRRIADLEKQLADREREMASLRAEQSAEMAKLKEAERGLVRSLRPQIEKGDITVDLNNDRLLINLASAYLFDSGKGELKPDGVEALKHVGAVLKKFPQPANGRNFRDGSVSDEQRIVGGSCGQCRQGAGRWRTWRREDDWVWRHQSS